MNGLANLWYFFNVLFVGGGVPNIYIQAYSFFGELIPWVNTVVVGVHNKNTIIIDVVPLMPISLMGIEIDDHDSFNSQSCLQIMRCQTYIWINAKPTAPSTGGMVISSR